MLVLPYFLNGFLTVTLNFVHYRYEAQHLPTYPLCGHHTKSYRCSVLTMKQCLYFHDIFYKNKDRQSQNNFILQYTKSKQVQRRRPKTNEKTPKAFHTKFFVRRNDETDMIPVCQNAFLQILQIKRSRVEFVTKNFQKCGFIPEETRGGDHVSAKFNDKKQSIVEFISSLACSDVHYCRYKSGRKYLPADLNIAKLHKMYNEKVEDNSLKVKECYFRYIFNRNFNIGFGSPRLDMCSTCIELKERMKLEKDPQKKHELLVQRLIHKKRAKAFYDHLKEQAPEVMNISFDCQKNLPLPKVPDQEAYYRRQLYLYNLTVVKGSSKDKLTKENCTSYLWTEDLHKKGSSEIASCIFHFLNNTDFTGKTKLRLFADGCGGQNKNQIILAMCSKWLLDAPSTLQHIEIIFPIRGHSFMPPDRIFGNCEKKFKSLQQIENPGQYVEIISSFSTVVNVGTDCDVHDWRSEAYRVFKPVNKWHFKFAPTKKFCIKRSGKNQKQVVIKGEHFYYHEVSVYRFLTKSNATVADINPNLISPGVLVKKVKLSDVKKLLEVHYGPNWMENTSLEYYKNLLEKCDDQENTQDEAEPECEETEESPETIV